MVVMVEKEAPAWAWRCRTCWEWVRSGSMEDVALSQVAAWVSEMRLVVRVKKKKRVQLDGTREKPVTP